jgi:quinol monooxygenase YgiN
MSVSSDATTRCSWTGLWEEDMPGFIQIIELQTSKIDEVDALAEQLKKEGGKAFLARRATTTEDRDNRGHYCVIVEFDSYEEAMKNSESELINTFSEKLGALVDGPPSFRNLDVVSVMDNPA